MTLAPDSHSMSQVSQCLLDWFTEFACLLHACCLSCEEKGMRQHMRSWYFKVLTNYNAWISYILYSWIFTSLFLLLQSLSSLWTSHVASLRAVKQLMHVSKLNICPEFLFLHQYCVHLGDATRGIAAVAPHQCKFSGKELQTLSVVIRTNSCGTVH